MAYFNKKKIYINKDVSKVGGIKSIHLKMKNFLVFLDGEINQITKFVFNF